MIPVAPQHAAVSVEKDNPAEAGSPVRWCAPESKQTVVSEAVSVSSAYHDMIQYPNIQECERFLDPLCFELVRLARRRVTGRVVVSVMCPKSLCGASCNSFGGTITSV